MAAIYTFKDLQDQVLATLDEAGDTGTTLTLVKNYLNQAQLLRLGEADWPFLRWDEPVTFPIVVGTRFYTLHSEYWRPIYFFNVTTKSFMRLIPERMLSQTGDRWLSDTGRAGDFRMAGYSPVAAQMPSAQTISCYSSSTNDTTQTVTLTGVSSGSVLTETVTLHGTATQLFSAGYEKILRLTLSAPLAGYLNVQTVAGTIPAIALLSLEPGAMGRLFPRIELMVTPDAADTIEYAFYRQPLKLVRDNDVPEIPPPYGEILVWDALMLFAGYNTDIRPQSVAVWKETRDRLAQSMKENFLEGTAIDSMPRLIRDMEDDWTSMPRVNR